MRRLLLVGLCALTSCGSQQNLDERAINRCIRDAGGEGVTVTPSDEGWFNASGAADADQIVQRCMDEVLRR